MTRTDTHRPSVLDPAEYTYVGDFDAHWEDGYCEIDPEFAEKDYDGHYSGNGRGKCDHCGQSIRYGVIFYHGPSDSLVAVGLRCAATLNLKSLSEKAIKEKAEYHRILRAIERFKAERPENAEAAEFYSDMIEAEHERGEAMAEWSDKGCVGPAPQARIRYNSFVADVGRKLRRYGSLSEKQVAAILKVKAGEEKFRAMKEAEAAKLADAPVLSEGRYEIEGTIISAKLVDGWNTDYRGNPIQTLKMLVQMDTGNRVFGSVPSNIEEAVWNECRESDERVEGTTTITLLRGRRIKFAAKVEPKEEHFGFFSRPTKAMLIEEAEVN